MATFKKTKTGWKAEICVNRKRESRTFKIKTQALEWSIQREKELREGRTGSNTTVKQLFERYLKEVSPLKKGHRWEALRLKAFMNMDISVLYVNKVSDLDVIEWRNLRLEQVAPSTVNRELNLLGHCFSHAISEWKLLDKNPVKGIKRPKNPPHRDRLISNDEIERIRIALGYPEDGPAKTKMQIIAVAFLFAIETAMRAGEICGLSEVHGNVAVLHDTKNGTSRQVALSKRAVELLGYAGGAFDITSKQMDGLFRKARNRAGVENLTFHDTRHEAITRLAKKLSILDLARMVGHKDLKMLQIYYNETAASIADKLD